MADILDILDYPLPPSTPPLEGLPLKPLAAEGSNALGLAARLGTPESQYTAVNDEVVPELVEVEGVLAEAEGVEDDTMDVDGGEVEVAYPQPQHIVDLTQDEDEEEDDVILLEEPSRLQDAASAAPSPPRPSGAADETHEEQPALPTAPESPALPPPAPHRRHRSLPPQPEDDVPMLNAEGQPEAAEQDDARPLAQESSEEHVLHMVVVPEPPLPMSRTASGQYSLSSVPPSATVLSPNYAFVQDISVDSEPPPPEKKPKLFDNAPRIRLINNQYELPPLSILPAEFQRKSKSARQSKRRDKDKDKDKDKGDGKPEWAPMGINKWGATIRVNPVFKRISKATKCLSTRDWNVRDFSEQSML